MVGIDWAATHWLAGWRGRIRTFDLLISGGVKIGDSVVVFAQGPIGLCATAGAKLMGADLVIGVDSDRFGSLPAAPIAIRQVAERRERAHV